MSQEKQPNSAVPSDDKQLSLGGILFLMLLTAAWFATFQLTPHIAIFAASTLLVIVAMLLKYVDRHLSGWVAETPGEQDRKAAQKQTWKSKFAAAAWILLYFLSAGPAIRYGATDLASARFVTQLYPFARVDVAPIRPYEEVNGKTFTRYLVKPLPYVPLSSYFREWWNRVVIREPHH